MASYTDASIHEVKRFESLRQIIDELSEVLLPPERISVSQAAEKYFRVYNPPAYSGPYLNSKVPSLAEPMNLLESRDYSAVCIVAPAQAGKAMPLDTPLATPSGWTTMGEVKPGDVIFDDQGKPTTVTAVTPVMFNHDCYRLTFDDHTSLVADGEHQWFVHTKDNGQKVTTTEDMFLDFNVPTKRAKGRSRYAIPNAEPLELSDIDLPIDPYVLGAWLGDGSAKGSILFTGAEDLDHFLIELMSAGYVPTVKRDRTVWRINMSPVSDVFERVFCNRGHDSDEVGFTSQGGCAECQRQHERKARTGGEFQPDPLLPQFDMRNRLRALGVLGNKHVPALYLRAGTKQRWSLLQGLMDTDGTVMKNGTLQYGTSDPAIRDGVTELLSSLGFKYTVAEYQPKRGRLAYKISFMGYQDNPVFRLQRKLDRMRDRVNSRPGQTTRRWIRNIEPVDSVPVRCITVDSENHLYLAGKQMVPTHNTNMSLAWLSYNVVCDPSDFMIVEKSQTEAKNFSMMKVDRMIRHSPAINERLIQRRTASNIHDKKFKSGTFLTMTWPTVNSLSGKTIRRVALSDYDRMDQDVGGEGSPFDLARRRTNTFKRLGMTYVESSPSYDSMNPSWRPATPHEAPPTEGIVGIYNRGDRRKRYWQCPHCGEWFEPAFSTLRWPESDDPMESAEGVFMACPHCFDDNGAIITQAMRPELDANGVWLRDGEKIDKHGNITGKPRRSDIASFWLKGPAAAFSQWRTLVINYLLAMQEYESTGNDRPLKTTVNTDHGEVYIPPHVSEVRAPEDIMARAVDIGDRVVPTKVRFLLAGIDVQENRFVVQVHGIVPAENGFDMVIIDRFDIRKSERYDQDGERFWVNPGAYPEDWDRITDKVLDKTYLTDEPVPRQMGIRAVFCDSGGRAGVTTNAYDYYRRLKSEGYGGRFWLVKGDGMKSAPRVRKTFPDSGRKDRKAGARGEIPVLMLNTDLLKDWLDKALDRVEPGGGYIEFPDWLELDFYKELCAEIKNPQNGKWENPKKLRNESTDLINYCYAGCIFFRIEKMDWDNAPKWAGPWDENPLVVSTEDDSPTRPAQEDTGNLDKLKQLAGQLG